VRVLIDWLGRLPTPWSYFRQMERDGLKCARSNPPGFRAWLAACRATTERCWSPTAKAASPADRHRTGWKHGMIRSPRSPWRDTAVRIDGDAARDLQQAFERMWARSRGRRGPRQRIMRAPTSSFLNTRLHPGSLVGIIEGEPWRLRVARSLQIQSVAAEKSIWIASAYFMPSWSEIEALSGAARDGVDVRVLVPSRYDHFWLRGLMTRSYQRLLRNGVRIWEWRGEMMHAKTSVVDGRWIRVGSTDFNPLGIALNYELDAVIEDPALGAVAESMFLEDLERSRELRPVYRSIQGADTVKRIASE
jgi:cardiolipin synthase